jgi:hypothetical protein
VDPPPTLGGNPETFPLPAQPTVKARIAARARPADLGLILPLYIGVSVPA